MAELEIAWLSFFLDLFYPTHYYPSSIPKIVCQLAGLSSKDQQTNMYIYAS